MTKILYAKASTERRPEFRQQTVILEEDGQRRVRKTAVGPEARAHINAYAEHGDMLRKAIRPGSRLRILPCEQKADGIAEFPFLRDGTLAGRLSGRKAEAYLQELLAFRESLVDAFEAKPFQVSDGFQEWFGECAGLEGKTALEPANLDMNFDNVFLTPGDTLTLIDYEWAVPFPVPADFILFRSLLSDLTFSQFRPEEQARVLEGLGISEADRETFWNMETAFQRRVSRDEDKLDFFREKGKIAGAELTSFSEVTERQQAMIQQLDHDLKEYKEAYVRQQAAIQKLDHDLNVYKKAYDEKQQELNEANRQLIEMTQKYQQLSGKWYVRLLNQKS